MDGKIVAVSHDHGGSHEGEQGEEDQATQAHPDGDGRGEVAPGPAVRPGLLLRPLWPPQLTDRGTTQEPIRLMHIRTGSRLALTERFGQVISR